MINGRENIDTTAAATFVLAVGAQAVRQALVYRRTANDWACQKARAVKAIDASSKLKTGLWQLAEIFCDN